MCRSTKKKIDLNTRYPEKMVCVKKKHAITKWIDHGVTYVHLWDKLYKQMNLYQTYKTANTQIPYQEPNTSVQKWKSRNLKTRTFSKWKFTFARKLFLFFSGKLWSAIRCVDPSRKKIDPNTFFGHVFLKNPERFDEIVWDLGWTKSVEVIRGDLKLTIQKKSGSPTRGVEINQLFNQTALDSLLRVLAQSEIRVAVHLGCGELTRADWDYLSEFWDVT